MSASPLRSPESVSLSVRQTEEQFADLRNMLFPPLHTLSAVLTADGELDDNSAVIQFKANPRAKKVLEAFAAHYQLTLSDFLRRLTYGVVSAHGDIEAKPVTPVRSVA